jgi:hypothetical protein
MKTFAKTIVVVMAAEQGVAIVAYLLAGNWKMAVYWAGACIINLAVLLMG